MRNLRLLSSLLTAVWFISQAHCVAENFHSHKSTKSHTSAHHHHHHSDNSDSHSSETLPNSASHEHHDSGDHDSTQADRCELKSLATPYAAIKIGALATQEVVQNSFALLSQQNSRPKILQIHLRSKTDPPWDMAISKLVQILHAANGPPQL